ncbi:hypothetical protein CWC24_17725 [Pseudoalteromonas ruthenica]|nr:hypothetical protein CWC24_17725 [Pseudoalteromonas ruthenica]TMO48454.1 hypothetical protein CWC23_17595 [Pseudoalteromonas ruthenica]
MFWQAGYIYYKNKPKRSFFSDIKKPHLKGGGFGLTYLRITKELCAHWPWADGMVHRKDASLR